MGAVIGELLPFALGVAISPVPIIALGLLLLAMAVKQWRGRPKPGAEPELPGWMRSIDKITPVRGVLLGFVLSAVNPKNLMLCAAAGMAIATGHAYVLPIVLFTVLAACSVAVPVIAYALAADRMRGPLDELRGWLERNNATVMCTLLLVLGVVLLGKGIAGL